MADVSVVVVTLNALPWIERCLESVAGYETIVVDNGSTDRTLELVRGRFPDVVVLERENRGLAAGWNAGLRIGSGRYYFLLNADAWVVGDGLAHLVRIADEHPTAAVVAPKLVNPDGTLQRSVRGFPTLWRLVTEYLFLRKLAPRSRLLNAFYAGGFDHDAPRDVDWVMGAALLVRREAVDAVGLLDESFFLFSEETDWCYRFHGAGWGVLFTPAVEVVHVGGAVHGGRLFKESIRSHLRFFAKHHGLAEAERARRIVLVGARLRALLFRGERRQMYREIARWLASARVPALLESPR